MGCSLGARAFDPWPCGFQLQMPSFFHHGGWLVLVDAEKLQRSPDGARNTHCPVVCGEQTSIIYPLFITEADRWSRACPFDRFAFLDSNVLLHWSIQPRSQRLHAPSLALARFGSLEKAPKGTSTCFLGPPVERLE